MGHLFPLVETEDESPEEESLWYKCVKITDQQPNAKMSNNLRCGVVKKNDFNKFRQEMAEVFKINNPSIPVDRKERIHEILARHSCVVSKGTQHAIATGDAPPIRVQHRRIPFGQRESIGQEVE